MPGTEVTIPGDAAHGDAPSPAYANTPAGATRGVVVIHEIFGRQPDIDRVVDRFATRGYAAVAPDLFHEGALRCIRSVFSAMRSGEEVAPVRQAQRARRWLCAQAGLRDAQVGIVGFCFGGGFALLAGAGWGAVSTNYGEVPPTERMRGIGPVIGCYGGRDLPFRNKGRVLTERLAPLGVVPEVHTFPTAGHAFLTEGDHPIATVLMGPILHPGYDPMAAPEAWRRIEAFFDRHLPPTDRAATGT
jgi:carboxymethylenebutenolidase